MTDKIANKLEKIYNEEFKPLYEKGEYMEAFRIFAKNNHKLMGYFSKEERQKMFDIFAKGIKPALETLNLGVKN